MSAKPKSPARPERVGKHDTSCLDYTLLKATDELTLALEILRDTEAIVAVGRALGHVVTARRFAGFIPSWTRGAEDGAS